MTYNTTMTSKGQVTIPVAVRRSMGLKPGESVRFRIDKGNQVVIERNDWKQGLGKLQEEVQRHLKQHNIQPLTDEELDDAINTAAQASVTKDIHEKS